MSTSICFWKRQLVCGALSLVLAVAVSAAAIAQDVGYASDSAGFEPEVPASYSGSGSFFNRKLGTALRFNYHSEGYGTQQGVVSIGGMKVTSIDDGSTWFFDGQGTLSDDFGGGFNAGVGYRVLSNTRLGFDPLRIHGLGFWTDGQSTQADNFFTQLGFSLESLGDSVDFRLNGYFPLDRSQTGDPVLTSLDDLTFVGNNLFAGTEDVTIDTSHSVVDGEIAKRIQNLEAWAFIGGYQLGGGSVDATGYRVGVRGYAVPDLALSLQVTDDDVYHTNVMFGITWFVGRTHRCNLPTGTILDRLREPVLRNDFVATTSRVTSRAAGDALTDTETGVAMRFVHVDSDAAGGGDGTFENPVQSLAVIGGLTDAETISLDNDKILVHSGSTLTGSFTAKNGQDILGEGVDANGDPIAHVVSTTERGLLTLPETSTDSSMGATPVITGVGDVFTLADDNAVNNFVINGGTRAVVADGVASPSLANLDINGPTGDAILLREVTGTAIVENTVTIDDAVGTSLLVDGGETGMSLAAAINDARGMVLEIRNRTGGLITYSGLVMDNVDDDGTFSDGILIADNMNATINLTGLIDLDTDASNAVTINGNNGAAGTDAGTTITFDELVATAGAGNTVDIDDGGVVTFNNTNSAASIMNTGAGDAVTISGDPVAENNAIVSIAADITNSVGGNALEIRDRTANDISVTGDITGSAEGILFEDNSAGQYSLTGAVNITTTAGNAFTMTNNEGASVSLTDVMLSTVTGTALDVTGGGTLTITDPNATNEIQTVGNGTAVRIVGDSNAGATGDATVTIGAIISSAAATTGRTIDIQDRTSNDVTFNGTISDEGSGLFVSMNTGGNILFTDTVTVDVSGANNGINLLTNVDTTISFNGLDIQADDGIGFTATGGGNLIVTSPAGTNTIETTTGVGLELDGITIEPGDVTFDSVTVTAGATSGIALTDLDGAGQLLIGGGTNPADGGTLTTAGTAITVDNVDNLLMTNVTVDNTTGAGLNVTNQDDGTVTFSGLDVTTTTADAVTVDSNTGGNITFLNLAAETTDGDAITLTNNTGATISFNGMEVTATGAGDGFTATGGGNLSASGTNNISVNTGVGLDLDAMAIEPAGASFTNVSVTAGATVGVDLNDLSGTGAVTVGSFGGAAGSGGSITTTGTAILVNNSNNVALNSIEVTNGGTAGAGVVVTNSAGDTFSMNNIDVTTSTGQGVSVTGGGSLTALGSNTITTTTGTGLTIQDVTVAGSASFDSVTVNGAANGIVLDNATGGQIRVGSATATGTDGNGGSLTTTDTAISVTGVTNAVFNDVTVNVTGAGNDAIVVEHTLGSLVDVVFDNLLLTTAAGAGRGIVLEDNGTGELDFILRNSTVDTTASDTVAFELITGNNSGNIDVSLLDNDAINTGDASAVSVDLSTGTGLVQFLISGNSMTNNSAASSTADFLVQSNRTLNATIGDQVGTTFVSNSFSNGGTGTGLAIESANASARINLDLRGNTATTGGAIDFMLTETSGTFGVVDLSATVTAETNNQGTFDLGGGVEADFDDLTPPIPQVD